MSTDQNTKDWYRDGYLVSTNPSLVQPDAFSKALHSDLMWWAKPMPMNDIKKTLDNSLCIGLYKLPDSTASIAGQSNPEMVGLTRVVTDYITLAYLTDAYVLPEHQGKGLGKWMMECLNEVLEAWPHLRRTLLITGSPEAVRLYSKTLGAVEFNKSTPDSMCVMQKTGPGVSNH